MESEPSSLFHDRKLTSGARRILERVKASDDELATSSRSLFWILLQELLSDENEAAAMVSLSADELISAEVKQSAPTTTISFVEWVTVLLRHGDRYAIQSSVEAITGTEHLLMAAMELDEWTRQLIEQHGESFDRIVEEVIALEPEIVPDDLGEIRVKPAGTATIDEPALFRILDASANRCREGLRVVEDFVRFGLDDEFLSRELKNLRHNLTERFKELHHERWIHSRDTTHDVGTTVKTIGESYRGTPLDVVRAGLKRTEEALRSLEEFSKVLDPTVSRKFEQSRYSFYTIEKLIETNLNAREKLRDRRLYLLVTAENCRYGVEATIRETVSAGVDIVQMREKSLSDQRLLQLGLLIRQWTHAHGALFIVNDRPDIAVAVGADGVHLGQDDLPIHSVRKIVGSRMLIGVSTHNLEQVREAIYSGADYLGVGPTFPSKTKDFQQFAGLEFVQQVARETNVPWFAIGGIDRDNIKHVLAAGGKRIAVSSAICAAPHPRGVAREFSETLGRVS